MHANEAKSQQPAAVPASAPSAVAAVAAPETTLWRFLGIPEGFQNFRDRIINRRGNHPGLERKPPLKSIADPANLESPNPAIKTAAEIKQAEDMKAQKIKAIKYLATIGCGCYDKDGQITDALLAATDDCTPDVRLATIEAIEDAVNEGCCGKCGCNSCCNEKITKRLSEMAYERDNDGCCVEPVEKIRRAAKRVLCKCCPGGPPTGPIEEEMPALVPAPAPENVQPEVEVDDPVQGESEDDEAIQGESDGRSDDEDERHIMGEAHEASREELPNPFKDSFGGTQSLYQHQNRSENPRQRELHLNAGSTSDSLSGLIEVDAEPILLAQEIQPSSYQFESISEKTEVAEVESVPVVVAEPSESRVQPTETPANLVISEVAFVHPASGKLMLKSEDFSSVSEGTRVCIFRRSSTGVEKIADLVLEHVGQKAATAKVIDAEAIRRVRVGDQAVCR
ncbi:hypothetical protein [Novipirellula aureliae]|nr:hypothetical protein [Novipirellula aureliae]